MARYVIAIAAAMLLAAALVDGQVAPCPAPGSYHLSCYTAAVNLAAASAAKNECFTAWGKPECSAMVVNAPANTGGCATPVLYKFSTAACRDAYQAQEKTNAACKQYGTLGLGAAPNRMTATIKADWDCATGARRLF
eukprot:jgi/Botrbrau1/12436/Bobra.0094s0005.1